MPLSSSSTRAQVLAAYADNAAYEENGSLSQARTFVTACRLLLSPQHNVKRASHGGRGAEEVELDLTLIRDELKAAQDWVNLTAGAQSGSSVVHPDFTNFRD